MVIVKKRYSAIPRVLIFIFKEKKLLMIRYSGKGLDQTEEKAKRKGIYNCIGGHVEAGQDIIQAAQAEAHEEAGIRLINPKLKGVINIQNFANKDILNFIVVGTTKDTPVASTIEGTLKFIEPEELIKKNTFPDLISILERLQRLKVDEMIVGTSLYDDNFDLLELNLRTT